MNRFIDNRGSGKTKKLMELAKAENAIFVCQNPKAMMTKAHAYGITGIDFLSYHEYLHMPLILVNGEKNLKVVIDELEQFTKVAISNQTLARDELIGYSLCAED